MLRIAVIEKDKCKPKKCKHECKSVCVVNQMGKKCVEIEDIAIINDELCIGCNACVKKCPFNAIKIVNIPSQIGNDLVLSYGENSFKLYKLPNPKINKIIGLIGANGVGKTTIMNILSGKILPNFGNENITKEDVLKNVRGTELQKYLKLLYDGKLKINSKPQNILSLLKKIKNKETKVKDVLKQYETSSNYNKIISTLELDKLFENNIVNLSGGELQKLVCTTALLKPSDVYIFDEPTNYLDIEYRIKIANLIKDLNINNKYIFIVEHDLSVLDFIADYVHIMYGEPSAYGVVSTLYSTLEGINIYFDGYIPADNMKFRKEPYKLNELYNVEQIETHNNIVGLVNYDDHIIKFDNFELKINKSDITSDINMIILLGKNGTGKSTYLNMLSETLGFNISYKKQINSNEYKNSKITVKDLLFNEIQNSMTSSLFLSDVIYMLSVNKIYDKKVKKLSGGEQQRLSIALCLGKQADIYLIDEPSASLDIEQRFNTTKVIKRFMLHNKKIGFIVEHDILMAISLAREQTSRVIVFDEVKIDNGVRFCETSPLLSFNDGINKFLKNINTTFRTDKTNHRPKINKLDSVIDIEQKNIGAYYK